MHLVTFTDARGQRTGILDPEAGEVIDITAADASIPGEMVALVAQGQPALERARAAAAKSPRIALSQAMLDAPIPRPPRNIFAVGKNYREHAREFEKSGFDATGGKDVPDLPILFTKATTSVSAPGAAIPVGLDYSNSTDYEGELGVVVGEGGRGISRGGAMRHVFGYTIINDVTARTLQNAHKQWFLGKSLDGYCPMGPAIVTADAIADVTSLRVQTRVNGELRQDAPVADLIFDIPTLIETLSRVITLLPGDVIATGTPVGVGIGFKPPRFLRPGDVVEIAIEPIGTLVNPVG